MLMWMADYVRVDFIYRVHTTQERSAEGDVKPE